MNDTTVEPHRGVLILIFGILGFAPCLPFGIIAWIMGKGDLNKMAAGLMDDKGAGMTKVGMILGIIALCLDVLALLGMSMLFFGGGGLTATPLQ